MLHRRAGEAALPASGVQCAEMLMLIIRDRSGGRQGGVLGQRRAHAPRWLRHSGPLNQAGRRSPAGRYVRRAQMGAPAGY